MSTSQTTAAAAVQLRSVPVSAIVPIEGWNPRMAFDDAELRALSASMLERGCLVPLLLQATADGTYRLVDGEKRYKAHRSGPCHQPQSRGSRPSRSDGEALDRVVVALLGVGERDPGVDLERFSGGVA
jgi:hypothetical protein